MASESTRRGSKGKTGKVFVWIILVLLIAGLAGFGASGLGGNISTIGSVGKTDITVADFQRALDQELQFETRRRGAPFSISQARQEGVDQRVLARLAGVTALSEETKVTKLSVGDAEVARQVRQVPAFQGPDGLFDRDAYQFALERNGARPAEFEDDLRLTTARNILQQAVTGGLTVDETYANTLYNFLGERRSFRWAVIDEALLVGTAAEVTEADLQSFYDDNSDQFMTPEIRKLTYAWVTPDMLVGDIEVDDAELRTLFEERADQYNQPERRLVERLSFPDMAAAEAAKTQIDSGETTFDALVETRGLTLEDVDQGEVSRADLDGDIADAVFTLTEPGISAPVETSLGPALYRINAVLEANSTPFEDVRDTLASETSNDRARRDILDQINSIDDLLAGGATLEDLDAETPLQLGTLDYTTETSDGIAGYDEFRQEVAQMAVGDFPELRELSDGGVFATRLDEVVAPTLPALAHIRDDVLAAWTVDQTAKRIAELGTSLEEQLQAGTGMEALGLTPKAETDLGRTEFLENAPVGMLAEVFRLDANGAAFVQDVNGVSALVELTNISAPDLEDEDATALLQQLNFAASEGIANDVFQRFGETIQNTHGISLNQTAINAVLTQFGGY